MDYVPIRYREEQLADGDATDLLVGHPTRPTIVRRVTVSGVKRSADSTALLLAVNDVSHVAILGDTLMQFGDEVVSVWDYFLQAFELNDNLDFILDPRSPNPVAYVWVHIEYDGVIEHRTELSLKDDGLFALRAKAGEKAERKVMLDLVRTYGHEFPENQLVSPGVFVIRGAGKRDRSPDCVCHVCGLLTEVKKRNRDNRYRVSHSRGRPFADENKDGGWHCFVFPNGSLHYVSNTQILTAFAEGRVNVGSDRYDGWSDLIGIVDEIPPRCAVAQHDRP